MRREEHQPLLLIAQYGKDGEWHALGEDELGYSVPIRCATAQG